MKIKLYTYIILLFPLIIFSQIENGIIEYKIIKNDFFDDSKTSSFYSNNIKEIVKDLVLELRFNEKDSFFKALNLKKNNEEDFRQALISSDLLGNYHKIKDSTYVEWYKNDSDFGKIIIHYESELNWELKNESKIIDGYKCYKATCIITDYNYIKNPNSEVIVWYCPKIPVKIGPKRLYGLPGLIFEATERGVTLKISKISLNTNENFKFEKPFDGKHISPIEYKNMISDYIEEMNKGY